MPSILTGAGLSRMTRADTTPKAGGLPTVSYLGYTSVALSGVTTCTFNNVPIGRSTASRKVVLTVHSNAAAYPVYLTSATINGKLATMINSTVSAGWERSAIVYVDDIAGSTATVVLNFSANIGNYASIGVFELQNCKAKGHVTSSIIGSTGTTLFSNSIQTDPNNIVICALTTGIGSISTWNTPVAFNSAGHNSQGGFVSAAAVVASGGLKTFTAATSNAWGVMTAVAFR